MLRQDRQSGTITRKQEEEEEEGGERRSRGTALHRKGKRKGGGVKGRPKEQLGHPNHRHRGPFSRQSMKRDRESGKRHKTLGKKGEEGARSLSFCLLFTAFP